MLKKKNKNWIFKLQSSRHDPEIRSWGGDNSEPAAVWKQKSKKQNKNKTSSRAAKKSKTHATYLRRNSEYLPTFQPAHFYLSVL